MLEQRVLGAKQVTALLLEGYPVRTMVVSTQNFALLAPHPPSSLSRPEHLVYDTAVAPQLPALDN